MGKQKPAKLPKQIAGVTVPKRLRRPGGRAMTALRHPLVADLAAAAIIAAAAAIRNNARVRRAAHTLRDQAGTAATGIGVGAISAGSMIASAAHRGREKIGHAYAGLGAGSDGERAEPAEEGRTTKPRKKEEA
jgi:hypothetical protein